MQAYCYYNKANYHNMLNMLYYNLLTLFYYELDIIYPQNNCDYLLLINYIQSQYLDNAQFPQLFNIFKYP